MNNRMVAAYCFHRHIARSAMQGKVDCKTLYCINTSFLAAFALIWECTDSFADPFARDKDIIETFGEPVLIKAIHLVCFAVIYETQSSFFGNVIPDIRGKYTLIRIVSIFHSDLLSSEGLLLQVI